MVIIDKSLESTSHTVQWLPMRIENKQDDRFYTEYFLMGTHNEADEGEGEGEEHQEVQNSIMICSINLPKLTRGVDFSKSDDDLKKSMSKIKVHKAIDHPQDVSKARAMLNNPEIVASFTNNGDINLYDFNKEIQTSTLKGHSAYGFGLNWKPNFDSTPSNILVSGGTDMLISVWDINKSPSSEGYIEALSTISHHTKEVNGIDIHPTETNIFASVSDDSTLCLWDMRDVSTPIVNILASTDGLNAVTF